MKQNVNIILETVKMVFFVIALLLAGCSSNELTREKAELLIEPLFPMQLTGELTIMTLYKDRDWIVESVLRSNPNIKLLSDAGLLHSTKRKYYNRIEYKAGLTTLAKPYIIDKIFENTKDLYGDKLYSRYKVVVGNFEFVEVTGLYLMNENTEATIEYTARFVSSPFNIKDLGWSEIDRPKGIYYMGSGIYKYERTARKYDDGWRLNEGWKLIN